MKLNESGQNHDEMGDDINEKIFLKPNNLSENPNPSN